MKIRQGFVSNSSSSSFVIHKSEITDEQRTKLIDFLLGVEKDGYTKYFWVEGNYIKVSDNFCFSDYEKIRNIIADSESDFYDKVVMLD